MTTVNTATGDSTVQAEAASFTMNTDASAGSSSFQPQVPPSAGPSQAQNLLVSGATPRTSFVLAFDATKWQDFLAPRPGTQSRDLPETGVLGNYRDEKRAMTIGRVWLMNSLIFIGEMWQWPLPYEDEVPYAECNEGTWARSGWNDEPDGSSSYAITNLGSEKALKVLVVKVELDEEEDEGVEEDEGGEDGSEEGEEGEEDEGGEDEENGDDDMEQDEKKNDDED